MTPRVLLGDDGGMNDIVQGDLSLGCVMCMFGICIAVSFGLFDEKFMKKFPRKSMGGPTM
jgi:hypothetical protein